MKSTVIPRFWVVVASSAVRWSSLLERKGASWWNTAWRSSGGDVLSAKDTWTAVTDGKYNRRSDGRGELCLVATKHKISPLCEQLAKQAFAQCPCSTKRLLTFQTFESADLVLETTTKVFYRGRSCSTTSTVEPSPESLQQGVYVCAGWAWHCKDCQNSSDL